MTTPHKLADELDTEFVTGRISNRTGRMAAALLRRQAEQIAELREALEALLLRDYRQTRQHDETHRGGVLWTICDSCGQKWADDEGGKPEWEDPREWVAAQAALDNTKEPT